MHRPIVRRSAYLLLTLLLVAPLAPGAAAAQDPVEELLRQQTGQQMTQQEILRRLAESGMTREQVKARLRQMGMDPSMADPYFDRLERGGEGPIEGATGEFEGALRRIGLVRDTTFVTPGGDTIRVPVGSDRAELARRLQEIQRDTARLPVFGMEVFSRPTTQFDVIRTGPVDPDYRLGPGDQLVLVMTGDVEQAYTLVVDREGYVTVPDVGRVLVNGLTMANAERRMRSQLGRAYSGVATGSTQVAVSVGELRTNQVFVIGEVFFPSAYQVSSLATVFHALHQAGGPTREGSFRAIQVRRDGEVIREVDLYEYLLAGDSRDDIRLLQGDIVFVPLAGPQVAVSGEARREAVFELREGEGIRDALAFAGGFRAGARVDQVHVYRILPPGQRTGPRDRVLVDVSLDQLLAEGVRIPAFDGDSIVVDSIRADARANVVAVEGQVKQPGQFEFRSGMTVWNLVDRAGGLLPDAFRPVAHVIRFIEADSTFALRSVSLQEDPAGRPVDDLTLQDLDRVVVFGRPRLQVPRFVSIEGFVKEPGDYDLRVGMTVEDLILEAGGFSEGAMGLEAEVSRLRIGLERDNTISTTTVVRLDETIPWPYDTLVSRARDGESFAPFADGYRLMPGDRVFVRQLPGFVTPVSVVVEGEVVNPGPYPILTREERLSSVLRRAGGFTEQAYLEGARLVRDSILVGIQLEQALEQPGGRHDVTLEPGDRIEVPSYDPMVTVGGAVAFDSRIPYREGEDLDYYLAQAGGTLEEASRGRVSVQYPNGSRAVTRRTLLVRRDPEVRPGSHILVPFETEDEGTDWGEVLTRTLSITSTFVTLLLAIDRL